LGQEEKTMPDPWKKPYDAEFKRNAVDLLVNSGKPLKVLARELGGIPMHRRADAVQPLLERAIAQDGSSVLLCADVALLFDPELQLDPLNLLEFVPQILLHLHSS
jgi:transposase-like protein